MPTLSPIRVVQLIAPGGIGGAETVVGAGAVALAEAGADSTVAILDEIRTPERAETFRSRLDELGVPHTSFTARGRFDPALIRALRRELTTSKFDVIHAHGYKASVYAATLTDGGPARFATHHGEGGDGKRVALYVTLALRAYRRFVRVFAVSEATRGYLLKRGISPDLALTIHNFISVAGLETPSPPPRVQRDWSMSAD